MKEGGDSAFVKPSRKWEEKEGELSGMEVCVPSTQTIFTVGGVTSRRVRTEIDPPSPPPPISSQSTDTETTPSPSENATLRVKFPAWPGIGAKAPDPGASMRVNVVCMEREAGIMRSFAVVKTRMSNAARFVTPTTEGRSEGAEEIKGTQEKKQKKNVVNIVICIRRTCILRTYARVGVATTFSIKQCKFFTQNFLHKVTIVTSSLTAQVTAGIAGSVVSWSLLLKKT